MRERFRTLRTHLWRVTTTACANASNQSVTDALIYTSLAEAQEALRRIEKRIDGMDRWFIRKEEAPKMEDDRLALWEYPIYWFVCWVDDRKTAKKWPYSEDKPSPPPSVNTALLCWSMFITVMFIDVSSIVAVEFRWPSMAMLTLMGIGFGFLVWGRTAKVREANAKLAAIKEMVNESSPTYRTGEPASHASIREIIG